MTRPEGDAAAYVVRRADTALARARPVYFWRRILRVLPCTSPRVFVCALPQPLVVPLGDERLVQH